MLSWLLTLSEINLKILGSFSRCWRTVKWQVNYGQLPWYRQQQPQESLSFIFILLFKNVTQYLDHELESKSGFLTLTRGINCFNVLSWWHLLQQAGMILFYGVKLVLRHAHQQLLESLPLFKRFSCLNLKIIFSLENLKIHLREITNSTAAIHKGCMLRSSFVL